MCIIYKPRRLKEPLSTQAFILKENSKFSVKEGRKWEARKNYIYYTTVHSYILRGAKNLFILCQASM